MNHLHPGIFIPLIGKTNQVELSGFNPLLKNSAILTANLTEDGVEHEAFPAVRISGQSENQVEYGLLLFLKYPHQMEYQKALQIINQTFNRQDDELTIPLGNVPAAGLGIVSKSVYVEIETEFRTQEAFAEEAAKVHRALQQPFVSGSKLILSNGTSGFEIHGTSPVEYGASRDIWQNYIGKALRREGYSPVFFPTWSTNDAIAGYLLQKSRELQEKNARDYFDKIAARNARLQAQ